jgi:hypothetical protein
MSRELHRLARPAPALPGLRLLMAAVLVTAGRALDALALRVMPAASAPPPPELLLEFHAEAGAPEGALYVDGQLIGHLEGVTRL